VAKLIKSKVLKDKEREDTEGLSKETLKDQQKFKEWNKFNLCLIHF